MLPGGYTLVAHGHHGPAGPLFLVSLVLAHKVFFKTLNLCAVSLSQVISCKDLFLCFWNIENLDTLGCIPPTASVSEERLPHSFFSPGGHTLCSFPQLPTPLQCVPDSETTCQSLCVPLLSVLLVRWRKKNVPLSQSRNVNDRPRRCDG